MTTQHKTIQEIIQNLPPNYPVGTVYLNGALVPVTNFANVNGDAGYFMLDGQVVLVDTKKVDGVAFGAAAEE